MSLKRIFIIFIASFMIISPSYGESDKECFEKPSRAIFKFNQGVDKFFLKPLAKGYNKLPEGVKKGTSNFTSNIATLLSIPNYLLQGEFKGALDATGSFAINTTVGVLGIGNPAAALGLNAQAEDLGQTLGTYGFSGGCYYVLPIIGPTTLRDSFGLIADTFMDPFSIVTLREKELLSVSGSRLDYYAVHGVKAVDFRGDNMTNFDSLEKNSIDMYASMKSIYLQSRKNKINNTTDPDDDDWGNLDN